MRCPTDGRTYTLKGSLVAPASAIGEPRSISLLIHGAMLPGDELWRFRPGGDRSYDFTLAMARRGHAVATVSLVGYGDTVAGSVPDGRLICQGGNADAIHQVVAHLKSGNYTFGGAGSGPAFDRVAIFGSSFGGQYTQVAAYSFRNIDALVTLGWADPILPSPVGVDFTSSTALTCFQGGEPKYDDGSGPTGYVLRPGDLAVGVQWTDAEPKAETFWKATMERDPCGNQTSIPARFVADVTGLPKIKMPVLVVDGTGDELIGWLSPYVLYQRLSGHLRQDADAAPRRRPLVLPGAEARPVDRARSPAGSRRGASSGRRRRARRAASPRSRLSARAPRRASCPPSSNRPSASQRSGWSETSWGLTRRSGSGGPSGSRVAALWNAITAIASRMSTLVWKRDTRVSSSRPALSSLSRSHMPGKRAGDGVHARRVRPRWPSACQSRNSCCDARRERPGRAGAGGAISPRNSRSRQLVVVHPQRLYAPVGDVVVGDLGREHLGVAELGVVVRARRSRAPSRTGTGSRRCSASAPLGDVLAVEVALDQVGRCSCCRARCSPSRASRAGR